MTKAELEKEVEKLKEQNKELKQKLSELDDVAKKDKVIVVTAANDGGKFVIYVDEIFSMGEYETYSGKKYVEIKLKGNNSVNVRESFETLLPLFDVMELEK